jgi:hypothetical protein
MQYRTLAGVYQPQLFNLSIDPDARAATREAAAEASDDALAIITTTTNNITKLDTLIADYEVATGSGERTAVAVEFGKISATLYSKDEMSNSEDTWKKILN